MQGYGMQNIKTLSFQWTLRDLGAAAVIILVGIAFFPLKGVMISPDAAWYLNNASRMYHDFSYQNLMIHRPLFPFFICLGFMISGKSIATALGVVRLFFVFNLLLAYVVGTRLYNRAAGIGFTLFLLSSFTVHQWSSVILVDSILPFFILCFILCLYLASENKSAFFSVSAGLILGATFLLKGVVAFFFIPLPICLFWLKSCRNIKQLKNTGLIYGAALFLLLPWLVHCVWHNDFYVLTGKLFDADEIRESVITSGAETGTLVLSIKERIKELIEFFEVYIQSRFILAPLLFSGLLYSGFICLFKGGRAPEIYLVLSVILFSPVVYVGMKSLGINFRSGQYMVLYFILYLMAAVLLSDISRWIGGTGKSGIFIFFLLFFPCLFLQVFTGPGPGHNFSGLITKKKVGPAYGFSFWKNGFESGNGWAGDIAKQGADWISKEIPAGEKILCQWYLMRMLDFFSGNQYDFNKIEYCFYHDATRRKRPLFIWPRYRNGLSQGNSLAALYEQDLLSQINENHIRYVAVTPRRNFLSLYLDSHPDFKLLHSITRGRNNIKIFRLEAENAGLHPAFDVKFSAKVYDMFHNAAASAPFLPARYNKQLARITGWDPGRIESFALSATCDRPERFWQTYEKVDEKVVY